MLTPVETTIVTAAVAPGVALLTVLFLVDFAGGHQAPADRPDPAVVRPIPAYTVPSPSVVIRKRIVNV